METTKSLLRSPIAIGATGTLALLAGLWLARDRPEHPAAPEHPAQWRVIELAGTPIGTEERRCEGGEHWHQRRYAFEVDGDPIHLITTTRAVTRGTLLVSWESWGPAGHRAVHWDGDLRVTHDGVVETWPGAPQPVWLDVFIPAEAGTVWYLDVSEAEPNVKAASVQAEGRSWVLSEGTDHYTFLDGAWSNGLLTVRPADGPASLPGAPLLEILASPTDPIASPREVRTLTIRFGGEEQTWTAPLPDAVPSSERTRLTRLIERVRRKMSVVPTPGAVDGLLAMQRGAGDCTEYADAFASLARSEGLETRLVYGLVYVDTASGPAFVPHAWVEVAIEPTGWVPVDPIFGLVVADAARVELGVGPFDASPFAAIAGQRITVLDAR